MSKHLKRQSAVIYWSLLVVMALLLAMAAHPVLAQDASQDQSQAQDAYPGEPQDQGQLQDDNADPSQDPPNRIAQLNYSSGSVSFQPGGEGDWVDAVLNRPLTTGDNLWADKNSRAELHIGSTALRIGSETSLTFLTLNDQTTQLRLSTGALIVRVRHLDDGNSFEVDTPNLAFDIQNPGEYRIDVNPDGNETLVTVWQGRGEVTGGEDSYDVVANEQARFTGTDQLDHEIAQLPNSDDFDNWAFQRDRQDDQDESANYVSTETTGYQDLDAYGQWHNVDGYGQVWTPAGIAADWAPYRNGHWVWIAPWGWTWVEDEPWGFAPFHYGRWAYVQSSWCWVPGPIAVRPIYSPALVAFVGGNGFSLSVGVGRGPGVGWFPLAPGEVYVPWYRTSRVYVNSINLSNTRVNVTQITNVYNVYNSRRPNATRISYVNQRVNNGITVVSRDTFVNARPVRGNIVRVDQKTIVQAPVTRNIGIQPGRPSVVGAGRPVNFHPPAKVMSRPVVGTRVPVMHPVLPQQRPPQVNVRTVRPKANPITPRAPNQPQQPGVQVNQRPQPLQPQRPGQQSHAPNKPVQPGFQVSEQPRPSQPQQPGQQAPRNTPQAPNRPQQPGFRVNEHPQPLQAQPNNGQLPPTRDVPRPPSTERRPVNEPQQSLQPQQRGQQPQTPHNAPEAPNKPVQPGVRMNQRPQPLQPPNNNGQLPPTGNVPRPPNTERRPAQPGPQGGFEPMTNAPAQQQNQQRRSDERQAPPPQQQRNLQQRPQEPNSRNVHQQGEPHTSAPSMSRPAPKQETHSESRGNDDHSKDKH